MPQYPRFNALIRVLTGCAVLASLLAAQTGFTQTNDTVPRVAYFQETIQSDFFGDDARAMGMGNTGIVTGNDGSALISNPANLARIRRIELRFGLSHQRVTNDSRIIAEDQTYSSGLFLRKTRINALSLAIPIPTYRGSLVVGFGLNRVNSFDRSAAFLYPPTLTHSSSLARETETGGLWKWTAGAAMDISPRLSAGLSAHLLTGRDEYNWRQSATSDPSSPTIDEEAIKISYVGVSGTAGATYALSHLLTAGVVIESPTYMAAEETWPGIFDSLSSYSITRPFAFGAGLSGETGSFTVTADLRYTDWSQLEITYDNPSYSSQADEQYISDNLREALSWHLGAEYLLPAQGVNLRAGYYLDPLPVANHYIESQRKYLTLGAGFLFDRVMVLDVAYVHGGYELRNTNPGQSFEKYTSNLVFVTFGYRT
ncbi:MAG: outer membrane protein transport protein [candidate division Zixibacteria bacterium]|nr:outer membrane protein transport protein [candidate division Zixibacteria bacterium]